MNPLPPDFWERYTKLMDDTMKNTQKLLQELGLYSQWLATGKDGSIAGNPLWTGDKKPEIKVDDEYVHIILPLEGKRVDNTNTRVVLEGQRLVVEGALAADIPLPVAVQKYGGRACIKERGLEIRLIKDKYRSRTVIPIESTE